MLEALAAFLLGSGLKLLSRTRLPQIDGELSLPGLSGAVEVIRDRWGAPHIYAQNAYDLFMAQGFVHAQDRLWQMELGRRTATGRLAELFGEPALDVDRASRTFGFQRLGQADWAGAPDDLRAAVLAYTVGVNAGLERERLPVEFSLIRHRPEPWQTGDTMALMRLMMWQLSHAWYGEIVRARLIEAVGPEHAAEIEAVYPPANPAALPEGIEFNRLAQDGRLQAARGPYLGRGGGSNVWALAGARTTTGRPMLANDMHLMLRLPSLWYQNHLVAAEFQVNGVSFPGIPMVMVGHNASIAWGMTLAFTDAEDLFVERFDASNARRYQFGAEWREAEVIAEEIRVKGRASPHLEEVIATHHGPVISDVVCAPERRVALNSMALRPSQAARGWLLLNRARNWDGFVEAIRLITAPQLAVGYADVAGNIGYWVTGLVPVRAQGDGTLPRPGWSGAYEWQGEIPFEEMPHVLNPQQGYVVSCNHRIVDEHYPHFLGKAWMNGYRARRIVEAIETQGQLSLEDMQALQLDVTCLPGREFVHLLEGMHSDDADVRQALELLRGWDGRLTPDCTGGTVYEVARYALVRELFEPGLGQPLTDAFLGKGFHPLLMPSHEFHGYDTVTLLRLLTRASSWWVEQAGGRRELLERGLRRAVAWLKAELGEESGNWQWGRLHRATFPHALGLKRPLHRVFNRGPVLLGGDTDTPCQTAFLPHDPYEISGWATSYRQIIDLGDLSRSCYIHAPGQSGHLASPHYDDLLELWRRGAYQPMLWTREQVERHAAARLELRP